MTGRIGLAHAGPANIRGRDPKPSRQGLCNHALGRIRRHDRTQAGPAPTAAPRAARRGPAIARQSRGAAAPVMRWRTGHFGGIPPQARRWSGRPTGRRRQEGGRQASAIRPAALPGAQGREAGAGGTAPGLGAWRLEAARNGPQDQPVREAGSGWTAQGPRHDRGHVPSGGPRRRGCVGAAGRSCRRWAGPGAATAGGDLLILHPVGRLPAGSSDGSVDPSARGVSRDGGPPLARRRPGGGCRPRMPPCSSRKRSRR